MEILIFYVLAALSYFSAYHCRKQRKFYMQQASEITGEVISWNRHREDRGRYQETVYDLEVLAVNGQTYKISTANGKARKYKKRHDITIIVPDIPSVRENTQIQVHMQTANAEQLEMLKEIDRNMQEAEAQLHRISDQHLVIIKEDLKSNFEFGLSVFMGVIFTVLGIGLTVIYISL